MDTQRCIRGMREKWRVYMRNCMTERKREKKRERERERERERQRERERKRGF